MLKYGFYIVKDTKLPYILVRVFRIIDVTQIIELACKNLKNARISNSGRLLFI